jgi:hypothetical protein
MPKKARSNWPKRHHCASAKTMGFDANNAIKVFVFAILCANLHGFAQIIGIRLILEHIYRAGPFCVAT